MRAVYRKELHVLLTSWNGWLAIALVAGFFGGYGFIYQFTQGYAAFESTAAGASLSPLLAAPLIAMGLFADERRDHTDRLLASLPQQLHSVALGKVLAALTMALICALSAIPGLLVLLIGSNLYAPMALSAWCLIALMLLAATSGCSFLAMGCPNRPIAFLCGAALMALCYFSNNIANYLAASTFTPVFMLIVVAMIVLLAYALIRNINVAIVCALLTGAAVLLLKIFGKSDAIISTVTTLFGAFNLFAGIDLLINTGELSLPFIWQLVAFTALFALFAALSAQERIFKVRRTKA